VVAVVVMGVAWGVEVAAGAGGGGGGGGGGGAVVVELVIAVPIARRENCRCGCGYVTYFYLYVCVSPLLRPRKEVRWMLRMTVLDASHPALVMMYPHRLSLTHFEPPQRALHSRLPRHRLAK
jgi:hypothetical protein